ncbi:MAG: HI1506-related protein [Pseudomonadota bacterium]
MTEKLDSGRLAALRAAIEQLGAADFTKAGQAKVKALEAQLGGDVSSAEIAEAMEGWDFEVPTGEAAQQPSEAQAAPTPPVTPPEPPAQSGEASPPEPPAEAAPLSPDIDMAGGVRIRSKVKSFRRAGVEHLAEPKEWPAGSFSKDQLVALKGEKKLIVEDL